MEDNQPAPAIDSDSSSTSCEFANLSSSSDDEDSADAFSKSLLDFRSVQFSPVLALKANLNDPNFKLPDPNAPKYLNLKQYDKAVPCPSEEPKKDLQLKPVGLRNKKGEILKPGKSGKTVNPGPSSSTSNTAAPVSAEELPSKLQYPMPGRRFLPHQMPVFRPRKEAPNTLVIMETITGPLGGIRDAMKAHRRVKIWTRNDTGIRGFVTGFIEAFDKHWNIALRDVDEQFQRKRRIKYPVHFHGDNEIKEKSTSTRSRSKRRGKVTSRISRGERTIESKEINSVHMAGSSEDVISLCRLGLSNLVLKDKEKPEKSISTRKSRSRTSSANKDSLQPVCSSVGEKKEVKSPPDSLTKSAVRKKGLKVFKKPYKDANGLTIIAQSKKYEIVERHVGQLFIMGNDIIFIETMTC